MKSILVLAALALCFGCTSQDIPAAHRGQLFDKTHRVEKLLSPGDEWTASDVADRLRECAEDIQELRNA